MRAQRGVFVALAVFMASLPMARADDVRMPRDINKAWQEECTSCHVGYPPGLLTGANWASLMAGLDKHFGSNAQLDARTAAEITAWLKQHAATDAGRHGAATLRITDTRWFAAEHRRIQSGVWKRPEVKSASNCAACHRGAADGNYDEDEVRVPGALR